MQSERNTTPRGAVREKSTQAASYSICHHTFTLATSFGRISLTCLPAPSLWISGNEEFDQPSLSSCFSAGH